MFSSYVKIFQMMTIRERYSFTALMFVIFVLSLIEVVSVVSILPFLQLLGNPSLIQSNRWLSMLYELGSFQSSDSFLLWVGVGVFLVTIFGLGLKMATIWLTTRFALIHSFSLSSGLLAKYLFQPYDWFLTRHTSDLGNLVLSEVDRVVSDALLPAMRLIPEFISVVLLVFALLILEPEVALGGALLFCGVYGLVYLSVRRVMVVIGTARLKANQRRFRVVQDATGGLKELKLLGLEGVFVDSFRSAARDMAYSQIKSQVIMNLPRQAVEAIAFGGIIGLILFLMLRSGGDVVEFLPTLGLVAAVGLRMIPALQQIYQRSTSIRQAIASLTRVHDDVIHLDSTKAIVEMESFTPFTGCQGYLRFDNVSFSYPDLKKPVLDRLTFEVSPGTSVGIVGGTGAGKTTLVDILLGLLAPTGGSVIVDGISVNSKNVGSWQSCLGYVPQDIFLTDGTIAENIAFGVPTDQIDMFAVERAAKIAALDGFVRGHLSDGYNTSIGERGVRLSGGQRQRIGIARALYKDPSILVFDEATSALDTVTENAVMESVRRLSGSKTVFMIAHRLSTVRHCDVIFLMDGGRVIESGTFEDLLERSSEFRRFALDVRHEDEKGD